MIERHFAWTTRLKELLVSEEISQLLFPADLEELRSASEDFNKKANDYSHHLKKESLMGSRQDRQPLMSQQDVGGMRKSYNKWSTKLNAIFNTLRQTKVRY